MLAVLGRGNTVNEASSWVSRCQPHIREKKHILICKHAVPFYFLSFLEDMIKLEAIRRLVTKVVKRGWQS